MAVTVTPLRTSKDFILFWRAGHGTWACSRARFTKQHFDYEMDAFVWSPDCKRVLFREGSSGDDMLDLGQLYCADIEQKKLYRIPTKYFVRTMAWADNHTVRYWPVIVEPNYAKDVLFPTYRVAKVSHVWHCH